MHAAIGLGAIIALGAFATGVSAHGYLKVPAARNWVHAHTQGFYNEMSLNRIGTSVCGGQTLTDSRFAAGGIFATRKITGRYRAGGVIRAQVQVNINHWGYFDFRLCPLSGPSTATEKRELNDRCLNAHKLRFTNGKTKHWILKGNQGDVFLERMSIRLPSNIGCKRCVLQWRYVTEHMCRLPGVPDSFIAAKQPRLYRCPSNYLQNKALPAEKFFNCADISITKGRK